MSSEPAVACFSDLEVVKASLLGHVRGRGKGGSSGRRWEKVWGVLWKGGDGWCVSVWGRKQQWKAGAVPLASVQLSSIKKFATTSVADRDYVLRLQLVDGGEWELACASSSVLGKWSDTLRDRLALHLQAGQTQRQTALPRDLKHNITSEWVSDSDEETAQLEEELRLVLVSCPQFSALLGEYSVLVEGDQLQVLGSGQRWRWTWSDVLWYCLGRDWRGWDREWQLEMKTRESCTPSGCVFTWAGTSLKRFYSLLCECAPDARVLSKNRGISVADDSVTEGQLHTWMKELFLVELCGETDKREQYWLSLRVDGLSMLDHVSKVMRWEWSLADVQEFTLDAYMGCKRLAIKVGSGPKQGVYYLAGERIAMVFVALKELMQQMETKHSEPAFEECTEGVCLAISPTARLGMKAVYHLTLTAAPKQCGHLVGHYQVTVSRNSLHLVSEGDGKRWCWQLEHIRRFSVQAKDSQLIIETGRRAGTGEGQFVFCGDKLRLLCLVLKELTGLLCVVTRVRRIMLQIRERIVLRLRTAAPHELIESFPIEVCASAASTLPAVGQYTFQIFCNELWFVGNSGEVVCRWPVENLNQVAMATEGETGVPQVILSGATSSRSTCTISCKDAVELYAVLQLIKEHHTQTETTVPDPHPQAVPPPVHSTDQGADGCYIIHHVKNANGQSVSREDCRMVLEEASLKLLRLSDGSPVWSLELCHLQGATMEGYTDGKGVLLVQTRWSSPHDGMQYLLLCQQPEQVFEALLRYAEEHKRKGVVHEQQVNCVRDSPMLEDSTESTADEDEEDALQTDSETIICCSTAWDGRTASVTVSGIPWSVGTSGSAADGLTAQNTEYSLTLSTSAVPPSALSLIGCEPAICPSPTHLAVPAITATSSATSVLSEMSDEVFYLDTEQPPAPSSLNLALFRPPRSITPSPPESVEGDMFAPYKIGDGWGGPLPSLLYGLTGVPEEQEGSADLTPQTPDSYERPWEVQEARIAFNEDLPLQVVAPQCTLRVCVVVTSQGEAAAMTSSPPPGLGSYHTGRPTPTCPAGEEEYWLHFCDAVMDCSRPCVTQTWSVDCDSSIGVELQSGLVSNTSPQPDEVPRGPASTVPHSVAQQECASADVKAPLELVKRVRQDHLPYMSEVLWVWFGEQQPLTKQEEEEEEEEPCFHLRWQDVPCVEVVVTCQAQIVVAQHE